LATKLTENSAITEKIWATQNTTYTYKENYLKEFKMCFCLDDSVPSDKNESNENESNENESNESVRNLPLISEQFNKKKSFELKMGPGLYVIWNTTINKFYVGQSNNVPARLSSHWRELEIRRHECRLMQEH